jgi:ABC-type branched-subunit amino acid transport system substrate-binding protein
MALSMIALAACGARVRPAGVVDGLGSQAANTNPGVVNTPGAANSSGTVVTAPGGGGSPVATATSSTRTGKPGATTPATAATAPAVSNSAAFSLDPQSEAAACATSSGNTASDKGVTANSITFGNVSGLTGPLPGTDNQGPEAVQALFSAVNAAGGICGRQLKLLVEDDQQDASTNAADVSNLISKPVFAFVGDTSDADNGGVPDMEQAHVPDVGYAINCNRSLSPDYWSPAGGSCEQKDGHTYFTDSAFAQAKAAGYLPTRMAFLAYNIGIAADSAKQFAAVYKALGGTICYTDYAISPASASLTPDVVQMQHDHCNGAFTVLDITGTGKLLKALQQQQVHLPYLGTTLEGYTPEQIADAGESAAQGLTMTLNFIPLEENQPAVVLYQQQLATYEPGKQPSAFGFLAWQAGQMLIYALLQQGHSPTRAGVVRTFESLTWNGGGALGPYRPASHSFPPCSVDVFVKGNGFARRAPSSGLFCQNKAIRVS